MGGALAGDMLVLEASHENRCVHRAACHTVCWNI